MQATWATITTRSHMAPPEVRFEGRKAIGYVGLVHPPIGCLETTTYAGRLQRGLLVLLDGEASKARQPQGQYRHPGRAAPHGHATELDTRRCPKGTHWVNLWQTT